MTGPAPIRATSLAKAYRGGRGVDDVTFTLDPGEVLGFLGPNGSGKTTTIRMVLGLIRPTGGTVEVLGDDPWSRAAATHRRLGYVPGDLGLYERMTGIAHVRYAARMRGMDGTGDADEVASLLELDLGRQVKVLSRGNRQKLGLVLALMHRPDVLVLDEPTSGLDPIMQQVFHDLMRTVVDRGGAVLLSSHILSEVQRVADRVVVIREGHLVLTDSVDALRGRAFARMEATLAAPAAPGEFTDIPGARLVEQRGTHVLFAVEGEPDALVKALARHEVLALDSHEADLDDIFLSLYTDA